MSEENSIIPLENFNRIKSALEFCDSLTEIKINTQEQYDNAVNICKQIKASSNSLESDRKELVKPFNDKVKSINDEYRNVTLKLDNAERVLKNGMAAFYREQERIRIEEQRKLEAEAEAKRRLAEERAAAELRKAEAYRDQGREEMAAKAEARAETAAAISTTIMAPIVDNAAKVSGVSYSVTYKAVIENSKSAVVACVNNAILENYVTIDIKGLERLCKAQKGRLQIDGIRFVEDRQVSVRT